MQLAKLFWADLLVAASAAHMFGGTKSSPSAHKLDHWPIYEDEVETTEPSWSSIRKAKAAQVGEATEQADPYVVKTEAHLAWDRSPSTLKFGMLAGAFIPWTWVMGFLGASAQYDIAKKTKIGSPYPSLRAAQQAGAVKGFNLGVLGAVAGTVGGLFYDRTQKCAPMPLLDDFSLDDYISQPWYSQYQAPQNYQNERELECTSAQYIQKCYEFGFGTCESGWGIDVINRGRTEAQDNTTKGFLCAKATSTPGRLKVGPCFLPSAFGGDYWVVAYKAGNRVTGGYAIVVGGQPDKWNWKTGRCGFINSGQNGMWIFHRKRNPSGQEVNEIMHKMHDLGLDTSKMLPVPQDADCEGYDTEIAMDEEERKTLSIAADVHRGLEIKKRVKAATDPIKTKVEAARASSESALEQLAIKAAMPPPLDTDYFATNLPKAIGFSKEAEKLAMDFKLAVYDAGMSYVKDEDDFVATSMQEYTYKVATGYAKAVTLQESNIQAMLLGYQAQLDAFLAR